MKTLVLTCIILFTLYSCNKNKGEVICSTAEFVFVNPSGVDIFNDSVANHLEISDFSVYTPDNAVNLNYYVYFVNNKNQFKVGINGLSGEGITYFKFGNITIDTIYAKYEEKGSSLFIRELHYNGRLIEENDGVTDCGTQVHEIIVLIE